MSYKAYAPSFYFGRIERRRWSRAIYPWERRFVFRVSVATRPHRACVCVCVNEIQGRSSVSPLGRTRSLACPCPARTRLSHEDVDRRGQDRYARVNRIRENVGRRRAFKIGHDQRARVAIPPSSRLPDLPSPSLLVVRRSRAYQTPRSPRSDDERLVRSTRVARLRQKFPATQSLTALRRDEAGSHRRTKVVEEGSGGGKRIERQRDVVRARGKKKSREKERKRPSGR